MNKAEKSTYNLTRGDVDTTKACHAPFVSMNFDQYGNISVCCFNKSHRLGQFPKDSISTAWNSLNKTELQASMARFDLSKGCKNCSQQIKSGNFKNSLAQNFDQFAKFKNKVQKLRNHIFNTPYKHSEWPQLMEFELTNTCNLECVMCSGKFSSLIRKNQENLPPLHDPYDESFFNQLRPFISTLKEARFLGGEPFLIDSYWKIWDIILEINPEISISITTNATVLNNRVIKILDELKPNLTLSIDSLRKETYEKIRKNARFDHVLENINFFINWGRQSRRSVSIAVCPMTLNWEEIPDIVEFCNESNIEISFNTVIFPVKFSLHHLSTEELSLIINKYQTHNWRKYQTQIESHNLSVFKNLIDSLQYYANDKFSKIDPLIDFLEEGSESEIQKSINIIISAQLDKNLILIEKAFVNDPELLVAGYMSLSKSLMQNDNGIESNQKIELLEQNVKSRFSSHQKLQLLCTSPIHVIETFKNLSLSQVNDYLLSENKLNVWLSKNTQLQ